MRNNGQQEMEAAIALQKIRNQSLNKTTYAKGFVKDAKINVSSIVWFSVIVSVLTVILAVGSDNYSVLFGLLAIPLIVWLMYRREKEKTAKNQTFMKRHFIKQGDPNYWSRENASGGKDG